MNIGVVVAAEWNENEMMVYAQIRGFIFPFFFGTPMLPDTLQIGEYRY